MACASSKVLGKELMIRKGTITRLDGKASQIYFDVDITDQVPPAFCLKFQNYYTAVVAITQNQSGFFTPLMKPLKLMQNATFENEAQNWWHISSADFSSSYRKDQTIRIFLFQSCSHWKKFEIRNIQVFELLDKPVVDTKLAIEATTRSIGLKAVGTDWRTLNAEATAQSSMQANYFPMLPAVDTAKRSKRKGERKRRATQQPPYPGQQSTQQQEGI